MSTILGDPEFGRRKDEWQKGHPDLSVPKTEEEEQREKMGSPLVVVTFMWFWSLFS